MVLLAAAICSKSGKPLMSRQYMEMPRTRVEGLLNAFPKLLASEKPTNRQHTFVETESVRYVYQPLDQLYVFLITTKASNILEDLETLRLFSRIVPEYCGKSEEKEVMQNVFELIFAFDEIVALGYRENINVSQVRTYVDMDSHDERAYYQIKKSQEDEARKFARDKARELSKAKQEMAKRGMGAHVSASNFSYYGQSARRAEPAVVVAEGNATLSVRPAQSKSKLSSGKAMQLGSKGKADIFDQLGDRESVTNGQLSDGKAESASNALVEKNMEKVHVKLEETISVKQRRDGALDQLDVHGAVVLRIADEQYGHVAIKLAMNDSKNVQMQVHPNMDKKAFQTDKLLMLKSQGRPYPVNSDASILKWRFQSADEALVPLSINCWPSETREGYDVNIEYSLENDNLTLENVCIAVPLPRSSGPPTVTECDGEYSYDRAHHRLEWRLPLIDEGNKQGSMEFKTTAGNADSFFPVSVQFSSKLLFCNISIVNVRTTEEDSIKFSQEMTLSTGNYEIV